MAAASVGMAVWPASGFARSYVDRLERAIRDEAARTGETDGEVADAEGTPGTGENAWEHTHDVRIRSQGLLGRLPQGVLATALCAATLAWGLAHGAAVDTALALPVVALLGVAGSVDAVCHRLPNRLLGAAALWLVVAIAGRSLARLATIEPVQAALWPAGRAVLCALGVGAVVFMMWLIPASGMGLGDVKLCALLGLWLGYTAVEFAVTGVVVGFFIAGLVAIGLLVTRRAGRKDMLAFGPYLAVGGWLTWMLAVA